jgi:Bcr/CflA subfamily drug resistance transporter
LPVAKPRSAPRGIAILLASLSALGPFSIDTYLPSFQNIAQTLGASQLEVQQTLSIYLLSFALMTLWHGAIADRFGRRRVILIALALFALASAGCAFATRIEHLWFWRAMQGITAGAGIVISRAIVRDLFDGAPAQRLMSQITMMFALAPAIAPVIGGWLQTLFGWRSVFIFLVLATSALLLACWKLLPETLPPEKRQSLHPRYLGRTYWQVFTSPPFLFACAALSLNFAGFFIYVLSAPVFLMTHLGIHETGFLWLFGPAMAGLMLGSWLSGRLAGRSLSEPDHRFRLLGHGQCHPLQSWPQSAAAPLHSMERDTDFHLHPGHVTGHAQPGPHGPRPLPCATRPGRLLSNLLPVRVQQLNRRFHCAGTVGINPKHGPRHGRSAHTRWTRCADPAQITTVATVDRNSANHPASRDESAHQVGLQSLPVR